MNEEQALVVAEALGGGTWQSGGDVWLVLLKRSDGKLIVLSDDVVCQYDDEQAFHQSRTSNSIVLH